MKTITLYNQEREKVGETYPRRAKQLVRSGKAAWLEENAALQILTDAPLSANAEGGTLVDNTNATPINSAEPKVGESDDLLMYIAKRNVREKQRLVRQVAAFTITAVLLCILFAATGGEHWLARAADRHLADISRLAGDLQHEEHSGADALWGAHWGLQEIRFLTHPVWVFVLGVMVAWGGWIFVTAALRVAARYRVRTSRTPKPDPVATEYARLKGLAAEAREN